MATSHAVHGSSGSFAGPLYDAAMTGSVNALDRLLEEHGRVALFRISLTPFADTPLHLAALLGHLEFTKRLLELRPELATEQDSERCTPLHLAAANGHDQVVRELLRADEKACLVQDQEGRVPLHLAAMRGRVLVVGELLSSTRGQESLKKKVDDGDGILHLCVKYNHLDVLKAVLASTGDYDGEVLKMTDSHGNTVLHLAVMLKQTKTVRFLVELPTVKTEMINATNDLDFTALDVLNYSPKDYKSLDIREILVAGAGAQVETVLRPRQPSRPIQGVADRRRDAEDGAVGVVTATDGSQEQVQLQESASNWRTWVWHRAKSLTMDYRGDWMNEARGSLMMVASLIATVSFTAGMAPPGGVWQQDTTESALSHACNSTSICLAGTAVLAYYNPHDFTLFMKYNMSSFFCSLVAICLLISGLPFKDKFSLWLLSLAMYGTISFLGLTFLQALALMFRGPGSDLIGKIELLRGYANVLFIVWFVSVSIMGLWHLIRLCLIGYNTFPSIRQQAKLSSVYRDSSWIWPRSNARQAPALIQPLEHMVSFATNDTFLWCLKPRFTIATTWNELRTKRPRVPWHELLWFPGNIPRISFISWLACLNRLNTKDRMSKWNTSILMHCEFCSMANESRDHLFFSCPFTGGIWAQILSTLLINRSPSDWLSEIEWALKHRCGKNLVAITYKLALTSYIYYMWKERNRRIFECVKSPCDSLVSLIISMLRIRILSIPSLKASIENSTLRGLLLRHGR